MKLDTQSRIAKFISSQQMENSEIQKRIIKLGKTIIKEFDLDSDVDTITRWMSLYIAEQITICKNAKGDDKIVVKQHCFETILKLWQHRSSFPYELRPFKNFDAVFRALDKLNPDNPSPYFYSNPNSHSFEKNDSHKISDEILKWLDIARGIDQAARICLEYIFHQSALITTDKKTTAWLKNAIGFPESDDISIIVRLIHTEAKSENKETAKQEKQAKQERLKSKIKQLDAFNDFNQIVRAAFVTELESLTQNDLSTDMVDKESDERSLKK